MGLDIRLEGIPCEYLFIYLLYFLQFVRGEEEKKEKFTNRAFLLCTCLLTYLHSLGASTINTQMFEVAVGIDAVIGKPSIVEAGSPFIPSLKRRDRWSSREEAWKSLRRNRFYAPWCEESFNNYIQYGLRDLPTVTYPIDSAELKNSGGVTLTCPVTQEIATFLNVPEEDDDERELKRMCPRDCLDAIRENSRVPTRLFLADIGRQMFPLYESDLKFGRYGVVSYEDLGEKATHSVPFEEPELVAKAVARFIGEKLKGRIERAVVGDGKERYKGVHPVHRRRHAEFVASRLSKV